MVPGIRVNTGCRFVLGNKRLVGPKGWSDILGPTHRGHRMERQRPPLAVVSSSLILRVKIEVTASQRVSDPTSMMPLGVQDVSYLESLAHQEIEKAWNNFFLRG